MKKKVLKNGAVCWECDKRRNKFACKAKLHVLDDQIIKETNDHTHATNRGEVQASKVRQEMNFFSCFGFMRTETVFKKRPT